MATETMKELKAQSKVGQIVEVFIVQYELFCHSTVVHMNKNGNLFFFLFICLVIAKN